METIKGDQYAVLAYFLIRSFAFGMNINSTLYIANQDAWISVIVSYILGFVPLIIYYLIFNHDPSLNINGLIDKYFNKRIGFIIKFALISFFIFHSSILLWNIGNFIGSQFLYKTPILMIMIILMIPIFYMNIKKISTFGRTSIFFLVLNLVLVLSTIITLASHLEIDNLLPMFENGINPIINASITNFSYSMFPIFALLIIPKNNIENNKKIKSKIFLMYTIAMFILALTIIYVTSIFGINLAKFYEYPEFNILKMVNIGDFIQRIESILSMQWFFDIIIGISIFVYYIKSTILEKIKINNTLLVFIISTIIVIVSRIIFPNNTIAYEFLIFKYKYIILFFLLVLPGIILIKIKK